MISFEVRGTPAPKGSMRAIAVAGRGRVIPGGSKANQRAQHAWVKAIRDALVSSVGDGPYPMYAEQPLEVHLLFKLERPAGDWGTGRNAHQLKASAPLHPTACKNDIDKLARSTLDALTGLLYDDDGRIVTLVCTKQYAATAADAGVVITIDSLPNSVQAALPSIGDRSHNAARCAKTSPMVSKC